MPAWVLPERAYDLPRNIALLDTNVLIAMFDLEDVRHGDTIAAIDLGEYQWGVWHPIIIEAWNFLVGKVKRLDYAIAMMDWLLTPGNVTLVADEDEAIEVAHSYSRRFNVDIVDAGLLDLANRLTRICKIFPP